MLDYVSIVKPPEMDMSHDGNVSEEAERGGGWGGTWGGGGC